MHATENRYIWILRWLGYLTIFATTLSLYDRLWLFELFTHFIIQYLVILTLLTIIFLYRRDRLFLVFLFFIAINTYKIHDLTTARIINVSQASSTGIKIATLNLELSNTQYSRVQTFIQEYNADILLLTEFTPKWLENLSTLETMYPHSYRVPMPGGFGIALYSRFPMVTSKTVILDDPTNPTIVSELDINGINITITGVHLFAPTSNQHFLARNRQLEKLAVLIKGNKSPSIVLGDFNTTSRSSHFKRFIEKSLLRNSTNGNGLQPTWPSYFFPFYIQLDHILLSEDFDVVSSQSKKSVGSDHFPLVAKITLTGS